MDGVFTFFAGMVCGAALTVMTALVWDSCERVDPPLHVTPKSEPEIEDDDPPPPIVDKQTWDEIRELRRLYRQ